EKVVVEYEPLPHILTLRQALAEKSFHNEPNFIRRGDCDDALANAPSTLEGEFELGGQEHFYLETQAAWAEHGEDGSMLVVSSTQHPSEVQSVVARVLNIPASKVVVQSPRMGGGFGGKETQAATPAALAALAAHHTGRPVRVRWNRDQDMILTGHRHPFLARFRAGFDKQGRLLAAKIYLFSNGGWSLDLSQAVTDRALFHLDNAYYIPAVEFRGQVAKTNLSSNTAFRGFGGPRNAGHGRNSGPHRAPAGADAGSCPRAESLSRQRRNEHDALRPGNRGQPPPNNLARVEADGPPGAAAEGNCELEREKPAPQTRHRHDPGEVRHQLHRHASEPGGRFGADLPGRLRAGEPRRHRDGPGYSHQHRRDCREGTGREAGANPRDADQHGQSAEYVRDGGVGGHGHERGGGEERLQEFEGTTRSRSSRRESAHFEKQSEPAHAGCYGHGFRGRVRFPSQASRNKNSVR